MNTPADALSDATVQAPPVAQAAATRPLYWSVRREVWENRSIVVGPLIAAGLVLVAMGVRIAFVLPTRVAQLAEFDPARQARMMAAPFATAASVVMVVALFVGAFYCLDALYGERRDRSILFWKSLPVSDRTAVLAKAAIPLAVLPAIALALALAVQLVLLVWSTLVLVGSGVGAGPLWRVLPFVQMPLVMVYGVVVHVLWHAPIYAWFLLVSAWARRLPLLFALVPPVTLAVGEGILFQTSAVCSLIKHRVGGAMTLAFAVPATHNQPVVWLGQLTPFRFLASPGLWLGLAVAGLLLAGAVRLRRRGEPL